MINGSNTVIFTWHDCKSEMPQQSGNYVVITEPGSIHVLPYSHKYKAWNCRDRDEDVDTALTDVLYWANVADTYPDDEQLRSTSIWLHDSD